MNFSISAKPHPDVEAIVELQAVPAKPETKKHGTSVGDVTVRGPDRAGKPEGALIATVSLGPLKEATAETVRRTGGAAAKWINGQSAKRAAVKLAGLTAMKMPNAPAVSNVPSARKAVPVSVTGSTSMGSPIAVWLA